MKLCLKFDAHTLCTRILQEQLDKLKLQYDIMSMSEIELKQAVSNEQCAQLNAILRAYGIEIVEDQKSALVQKVKDTLIEMVALEDKVPPTKVSCYLAKKLNHNYYYLAHLFSATTHTSIENFIIMQKIERAKQLMTIDHLTLTEIYYKLNYCSVAHLSNQFKKYTGLTPSAFQRIINKKLNLTKIQEEV